MSTLVQVDLPDLKENEVAFIEVEITPMAKVEWIKSEWKKPEATDAIVARMGHMPQK
jgi:hypothetical protein|tara:strand:+ start:67 stop:237 length:171 start_codon:yes stop_codon:yes gene_type:complete